MLVVIFLFFQTTAVKITLKRLGGFDLISHYNPFLAKKSSTEA